LQKNFSTGPRAESFERITRYNPGLTSIGNSLETVGSYTNNSDLKEFFKSCVDIYAFININHRNERNILSNL
jgi:hypothetical protein